jgi:hypothetical protein
MKQTILQTQSNPVMVKKGTMKRRRSGNFSRKRCFLLHENTKVGYTGWSGRDPFHSAPPLSRLERPLLLTARLPAFSSRWSVATWRYEKDDSGTISGNCRYSWNIGGTRIVLCFHGSWNIFYGWNRRIVVVLRDDLSLYVKISCLKKEIVDTN